MSVMIDASYSRLIISMSLYCAALLTPGTWGTTEQGTETWRKTVRRPKGSLSHADFHYYTSIKLTTSVAIMKIDNNGPMSVALGHSELNKID